jgi:2-polyprenyl-6-hydroxyphenyl methylase / 3-demethylubiquinone-9 3-methyltransferase
METSTTQPIVNNAFYQELGERWYHAWDDPVALLRMEGKLKNPWVAEKIWEAFPGQVTKVLDIGCGAGFLTNSLSALGHKVMGVDLSPGSLHVAHTHDATSKVRYQVADAYRLPFQNATFEIVTSMDFLEHVDNPQAVVAEASRVLKPGGLFFFHTFNRNRLAWLVVIKGVEWFVKNTPKHMHILPLFVKPTELASYCTSHGMQVRKMIGIRPEIGRLAFWKMLATRRVPEDFRFRFTPSLAISYLGYAQRDSQKV